MHSIPIATNDEEGLDDLLGAGSLAELRRLVDELESRLTSGQLFSAIGSAQAANTRCEDVAGWLQRLIVRQAQAAAPPIDAQDAGGLYL